MDRWKALWQRLRGVNPLVVDVGLALALFGITLGETATLTGCSCVSTADTWWTVLFMALVTLPLALRRRYPFAVLCVIGAAKVLDSNILNIPPDPFTAVFPVLLAVYTCAAYARRSLAYIAGGVTLVALVVFNIPDAGRDFGNFASQFVLIGGAWIVGPNPWYRRQQGALLRERAERAEQEREERARLAALEERGRIAREIHDVVAHSVGVVAVQAGAARAVVDRDPEQAREALAAIEGVSRETMSELRRLLGVLREPGEDAGLAPQPGLGRLGQLAEQFRRTGLQVEVTERGGRRDLLPGLDLSAYRVVQEALTNSLKHSGATVARVLVSYGADALDLEVSDEGGNGDASRAPLGTGQGLVGMRERVAMFGGTLQAGPTDGGFVVRARFPMPPEETDP